MPETDLALLTQAARASGDIANRFFKSGPQIWDKGDGQGPVTEADLAVNDMLARTLQEARPAYGWLSEETEDTSTRLTTKRQFIIDPIDGTRAFIEGARDWSHSLAVAENGKIIAAAVYVPQRDLLFAAGLGMGATLNGTPIQTTATTALKDATVLGARPNFDAKHWINGTPPVTRHFRSSLAYRLCLVAQGRFDAMITLRDAWEWDIAAGALIVQEARGTTSTQRGADLRFNNTRPLLDGVVAAGALHQPLIDALV